MNKNLPKNALVQTFKEALKPFETAVVDDEIRIVVMGGIGSGKTHTILKISEAIALAMKETDVIVMNDLMDERHMGEYIAANDVALAAISKRVKKVTIFEAQTNDSGFAKGTKQWREVRP